MTEVCREEDITSDLVSLQGLGQCYILWQEPEDHQRKKRELGKTSGSSGLLLSSGGTFRGKYRLVQLDSTENTFLQYLLSSGTSFKRKDYSIHGSGSST